MPYIRLPEIVDPSDGFSKPKQPNSVLLLRGAGHNMMNERLPGAQASELSDLQTIEDKLGDEADKLGLKLYIAQSNVEGYLLNHIHAARQYSFMIFSPGALCHYAYALYDALLVAKVPWIEVHLANMFAKEDFRKSVLAPLASGMILGCGPSGYKYALYRAKELIDEQGKSKA